MNSLFETARRFGLTLALCATTAVGSVVALPAHAEPGSFHVSAYGGRAAEDRLLEIVTRYNTGFVDSYLAAIAPAYVHARTGPVRWEIEGQVARHWGEQHHWEFNGLYIARWTEFPWDHYVDTSFAFGGGLSWATEVPRIEPRAKEFNGGEESEKLLGYLLLEIEGRPPGDSNWSGFIRLHHRSGASGLISNVRGGSNFITLGARYYF